jgi:ribosome-associated toxin RatA of RatAB toxin-antitoxin module
MTVSAAVDRVWHVLTSFEEMPAYLSSLSKCTVLRKNGKYWLVEQIARVRITILPLSFRVILEVVEDRPFLHFKQRYGSFTRFRGYWQVEECSSGNGSVVRYYLEAGLSQRLRGRPFEQQYHRMVEQNMKELALWIDNSEV